MTSATSSHESRQREIPATALRYPLFEALRERRSRRFGRGMRIPGGPLAFRSEKRPLPLSEEEQALLAFAACGISGSALSDWSFGERDGGNMMAGLVGRTIASADAIASVAMIVIDDQGAYLARRPRDFAAAEISELIALAADGRFVELWRRMRVRIADERCAPPLEPPFNLNPNRWSLHAAGSTYFLPVGEMTFILINALLELFNEHTGFFVLDERRLYMPAGVARFARSKGGHLDDDPRKMKAMTIEAGERVCTELVAVEQGMALQNLGLACQALGLGGFAHYSYHDEAWFRALGFRMETKPLTSYFRIPPPGRWVLRRQRRDPDIAYPVALERDGQTLLRPYCPPHYATMAEAVRAVVDFKLGTEGTFRTGISAGAWRDPGAVARGVPPVTRTAIEATTAFCEYVWHRYGRFPAYLPPFHTMMGFQAVHLDPDFYDRFYDRAALGPVHRDHMRDWHGERTE